MYNVLKVKIIKKYYIIIYMKHVYKVLKYRNKDFIKIIC